MSGLSKAQQIALYKYILTLPTTASPITIGDIVITDSDIGYDSVTDTFQNTIVNAYDSDLDVFKMIEQSPLWNRYTDTEILATAQDIGATNDTWKDQGIEINCEGYNYVNVFIVFTANNSTGNQLQVLSKHTTAGADEYVLESTSDYQKTIGDSDIKILYKFPCKGVPFIQLQTKATLIGATEGTVTINITKTY